MVRFTWYGDEDLEGYKQLQSRETSEEEREDGKWEIYTDHHHGLL